MEKIGNLFYHIFPKRVMDLADNSPIYGYLRPSKKKNMYSYDYSFSPNANFYQGKRGYYFLISEQGGEIKNYPIIWFLKDRFYVLKSENSKPVLYKYIYNMLCFQLEKQFSPKERIEINANNFINDTNYCYFNSIFQLILTCSVFNWYIIDVLDIIGNNTGAQLYEKFAIQMSKKEREPNVQFSAEIEPLKEKGIFVGTGDFIKGKMCDAGEFLETRVFPVLSKGTTPFMTKIIKKEMRGINPYIRIALKDNNYSVIDYLFGNIFKQGLETKSGRVSISRGEEQMLHTFPIIPSESATTLEEHIREFVAQYKVEISYIAHYFVIHRLGGGGTINDLPISDFDVAPYIKRSNECLMKKNVFHYRLIAMVVYTGGIHYYGIYWRKDGYYLLDSASQSGNQKVDEQKIKQDAQKATIFVYERKYP